MFLRPERVGPRCLYDCLHRRVEQLDMAEYRQWTLEHFGGTLCVGELHLGRYALLLATDPLGDFPVAFALVEKNDQAHMRRFLENLKRHGLSPEVVITDGSDLYPAVLADLRVPAGIADVANLHPTDARAAGTRPERASGMVSPCDCPLRAPSH